MVMDDGSEDELGPNDVMLLPPGHDAWSVGGKRCVFVEFSRGNDYYDELTQRRTSAAPRAAQVETGQPAGPPRRARLLHVS